MSDDIYPVHEGIDQPSEHKPLVPVDCPLCGTRLYAEEEQVDQEVQCPDCHTQMTVKPREAVRVRQPRRVEGEYGVSATADQPAAEELPKYVKVKCLECGTLLHPEVELAGTVMPCPDCGCDVRVPFPEPKKKPPPVEVHDPYAVEAEPDRPAAEGDPFYAEMEEAKEEQKRRQRRPRGKRPKPPQRPLVTGVFNFPFYPGVFSRWMMLCILGGFFLFFLLQGTTLAATAGDDPIPWLMSFIFSVMAFLAGVFWLVMGSPTLLATLGDTAAGNDEIEQWSEGSFLDHALEAIFIAAAVGVGVVPGAGLAWLLGLSTGWQVAAGAVSLFGLFPLALLSEIDCDSPFLPVSPTVFGTAWKQRGTWLVFYLESLLLAAGSGSVLLVTAGIAELLGVGFFRVYAGLASPTPLALMLLPWLALSVALLLIYFRLLGRVAFLGEHAVRAEAETEAEPEPRHEEESVAS